MPATVTAIPELDLADPAFVADPYPAYARLRAGGPRWSGPLRAWLVADHHSVAHLLRSQLLVRHPDASDEANRSLQRVEGPEHGRLRSTVADVFHGAGIRRLTRMVGRDAGELVAHCASGEPLDLMAGLAHPLAIRTIARVLGLPAEDLGPLAGW